MKECAFAWGENFKRFRESRGMSLKEAAGDFCTPQYLGRFEKGMQKINTELLDLLIGRLGVNMTDFITDLHSYNPSYSDKMAETVYAYIQNGEKADTIWKEIDHLYEHGKKDDLYLASYYVIFLKTMYHIQTNIPLENLLDQSDYEKVDYLKNRLLDLDELYTFDYAVLDILLDPIPDQFSTEYLLQIFNSTIKKLKIISNAAPMIHQAVSFLGTAIRILPTRGEYALAEDCVKKVYKLLNDTPMVAMINPYFQMIIAFQEAHNLLRQNKVEGIDKAHHIIRTLDHMIAINPLPRIVKHKEQFVRDTLLLNKTGLPIDLKGGE